MGVDMDPLKINEELKKVRETHATLALKLLQLELDRKTALEAAKNAAAVVKGDKAPSEASCERTAKTDGRYLQLCKDEIAATKAVEDQAILVEYTRNKFQVALALTKP